MKPYHNKNYQKVLKKTDLDVFKGKLKKVDVLNNCFVGIPNLWVSCFIKKIDLPFRKFLNWIITDPPFILVNQHSNLPFPLPILTPFGFLVNGKWGNALNQTKRRVWSDFLLARFKNNFNRNNWFEVKWSGLRIIRPALP